MAGRAPASEVATPSALADLREKGFLTRLMILRALARGPPATLRPLADELGVTVQAVSEQLKRLAADGFVTTDDDGPKLTAPGFEAAREGLLALKAYVDSGVRELRSIDTTAARAGARVKAGDAVGLFMEDGELVAYPKKESPSRGVAAHDAAAGEDVFVRELSGIVNHATGRIALGIVPDARAGGSRKADAAKAKRVVEQSGVVIVRGPVARRVAEAAGARPVRYGGAAAAAEAAVRGVHALLIVEASDADDAEAALRRAAAEFGLQVEPHVERL